MNQLLLTPETGSKRHRSTGALNVALLLSCRHGCTAPLRSAERYERHSHQADRRDKLHQNNEYQLDHEGARERTQRGRVVESVDDAVDRADADEPSCDKHEELDLHLALDLAEELQAHESDSEPGDDQDHSTDLKHMMPGIDVRLRDVVAHELRRSNGNERDAHDSADVDADF